MTVFPHAPNAVSPAIARNRFRDPTAAALRAVTGLLRGTAIAALDLVLPPSCPACDARVSAPHQLCAECFGRAAFIRAPSCRHCGVSFGSDAAGGPQAICLDCLERPPNWAEARAALLYDDWSRRLLLPFKYAGRTEHARPLSRFMAASGGDLLDRAELLVPVPLHRSRLRERGYNQAALLAYALRRHQPVPVLPDALRRIRATERLARLSAAERRDALVDAIAVRPHRASQIQGRRVLLIDDILTTGTTLARCTEALLAGGAARVDVLVAARTPPVPHAQPDSPA